jgi:hypothetical protein
MLEVPSLWWWDLIDLTFDSDLQIERCDSGILYRGPIADVWCEDDLEGYFLVVTTQWLAIFRSGRWEAFQQKPTISFRINMSLPLVEVPEESRTCDSYTFYRLDDPTNLSPEDVLGLSLSA